MKFTISIPPRTKKNSQRIVRLKNGAPCVIPSAQYKQYEKDACYFVPAAQTIETPVNVKALFYMDARRRVDLVNLQEALLDVLVHAGLLKDDNSSIVVSMDGSRVLYDKERPRTEVTITPAEEEQKQSEGEWKYNPNGMDWGLGAWECSLCRCRNDNLPMDENIKPLRWAGTKFCPNCGAKMKGR